MKSSRALSVIFPLTAALAVAQTAISVATTPPTPVAPVTAVSPTITIGGVTSAEQAVVAAVTTPSASVATATAVSATGTTAAPERPIVPAVQPSGTTELAQARGETTVQLDVSFGIRPVLPSRVSVPVGETLRIVAPEMGDVQYIWTKNGRAIDAPSSHVLVLSHVVSSDAGTYACLYSTPATLPKSSQALLLGVGPTDRLQNLSTRAEVTPTQPLTTGFVVSANPAGKKLILRAVGPSLALFGVANPLRAPVLRIFDGNGQPYTNGYAYPAVIGGPTYESDLAESLARAGAFPLPAGTADAVVMMPFIPGSYTAHVTSGDGSAGTVLFEIYEVP